MVQTGERVLPSSAQPMAGRADAGTVNTRVNAVQPRGAKTEEHPNPDVDDGAVVGIEGRRDGVRVDLL